MCQFSAGQPLREVIRSAVAGSETAWRHLHALADPVLRSHAANCLGPDWFRDSQSDVAQDAWLKVRAGLAGFRGAPSDEGTRVVLFAWLRVIVHGVVKDRLAHRARALGASPAVGVPDPVDSAPRVGHDLGSAEQRDKVRAAVAGLPDPLDRDVVGLHFFETLSLGEIADRLGLTYDQVRGRMARALGALGRVLREPT